jgi:glycosyltransferase involved in cell wall biosynthesis
VGDPQPTVAAPAASVIVPVRNRRELLADLLRALDVQTRRDFEVLVVDGGSTDGTADAAERSVAGRPVRVLRHPELGVSARRDAAVKAAKGKVLAFTDSDCAPAPDWLEAGLRAIDDGADMVHGSTRPARPVRPLERSVGSEEDGLFATCNAFYRRSAFEQMGGFVTDDMNRLRQRMSAGARDIGFGEDTLVGWRVVRAGGDVRHEPDAVVYHHVFPPDLRGWVTRCWMASAFPALFAEIPELRRTYVRSGVLFGGPRRVPMYVTAFALAARRPRLAAVGAGWWIATRLRGLRRTPASWPERIRAVPQEMLLDVVTGAALVLGSARNGVVAL